MSEASDAVDRIKALIDEECEDLSPEEYLEVISEVESYVETCREAAEDDLRRKKSK